MPKIYLFSNTRDGGAGPCYALAEDGTILWVHVCGSERHVQDVFGRCAARQAYRDHYPDGYKIEFVPARLSDSHLGLLAAIREYHRRRPEVDLEVVGTNHDRRS